MEELKPYLVEGKQIQTHVSGPHRIIILDNMAIINKMDKNITLIFEKIFTKKSSTFTNQEGILLKLKDKKYIYMYTECILFDLKEDEEFVNLPYHDIIETTKNYYFTEINEFVEKDKIPKIAKHDPFEVYRLSENVLKTQKISKDINLKQAKDIVISTQPFEFKKLF